jgi:two-component system sensor histidine kinase KdpD
LSSISHDLRTPLASIIGSITALKNADRTHDATTREALIGTIRDEADRLNRFVGNLLDITRLEGGTLQFRKEAVDLSEVVETALRRAARMLAQHRLQVDLAPDMPMVSVDIALLEQVLFNLLDNASKYAPAGSLIRIQAEATAPDTVRIEVQDEGEGIPPEQLEQIFDKFHRVRDGDTRTPGTGLGLAICRGFIEGMGGRIVAANRADRPGARFIIDLPSVPAAKSMASPS